MSHFTLFVDILKKIRELTIWGMSIVKLEIVRYIQVNSVSKSLYHYLPRVTQLHNAPKMEKFD